MGVGKADRETGKRNSRTAKPAGDEPGRPHPGFERLVERTTRAVYSRDPIRAVQDQYGGRIDLLLPDHSEGAEQEQIAEFKGLAREFEKWETGERPSGQAADAGLARGTLAVRAALLEHQRPGRRHPHAYVEEAVMGCVFALMSAGSDRRSACPDLLRRLRAIPAHLGSARENVRRPVALFTELALYLAQEAIPDLRSISDSASRVCREESLRRALEKATIEAIGAMGEYQEHLTSELMTQSTGDPRLGKVILQKMLKDLHGVSLEAEELITLGERLYHRTLREVRATAGKIRPRGNWSHLLEELSGDHPQAEELLGAYEAGVREAHRQMKEQGWAGLPSPESIEVLPMPVMVRWFYPQARFIRLGSAGSGRAILWVAAAHPSDSRERLTAFLRDQCRPAIAACVRREVFPGFGYQQAASPEPSRRLRDLFAHPGSREGWSLYAQCALMEGQKDPRQRFFHLRHLLWQACNVIVDVGLHSGMMSFTEATDFLVRKAKLSRVAAMTEARRFCLYPGLGLSPVLGRLLTEELAEDWRRLRGRTEPIQGFHEELLRQQGLPILSARLEMGIPLRPRGMDLRTVMEWGARVKRGENQGAAARS